MSAGLEEIAQAVAVAVEDKDLRDRIYAKCMEKFDGETNVLWQQLEADATLKSKGGWSKKVDSELGKGRKNVVVKGIGNVDAAVKKFEKAFNAPVHLFWAFPRQKLVAHLMEMTLEEARDLQTPQGCFTLHPYLVLACGVWKYRVH
ncbi:MAG: hypothetical protein ACOVSW_15410 [Candidatus Kapaibacteriota bacterium]|jgi:hypothetical protein